MINPADQLTMAWMILLNCYQRHDRSYWSVNSMINPAEQLTTVWSILWATILLSNWQVVVWFDRDHRPPMYVDSMGSGLTSRTRPSRHRGLRRSSTTDVAPGCSFIQSWQSARHNQDKIPPVQLTQLYSQVSFRHWNHRDIRQPSCAKNSKLC